MAFGKWAIGACNCGPCTQTVAVAGCGGLGLPGAAVSLYDHAGGTLLASGITDGSGQAALSWAGGGGGYYLTVTAPRFDAYAATVTLTCGGLTALTLSVSSGYHCLAGCPSPLPGTLVATYAGKPYTLAYGTYTYGGGPTAGPYTGWANPTTACIAQPGTVVHGTFPAVTCIGGNSPTNIVVDAGGVVRLINYQACSLGACALAAYLFEGSTLQGVQAIPIGGGGTVTCAPSFEITGSFPATFTSGGTGCPGATVGTAGGGGAFTVTE